MKRSFNSSLDNSHSGRFRWHYGSLYTSVYKTVFTGLPNQSVTKSL